MLFNIDDKIKITYNKIKNGKVVISYGKYSNDVPKGQKPNLLERAEKNNGELVSDTGQLRNKSNKETQEGRSQRKSQEVTPYIPHRQRQFSL